MKRKQPSSDHLLHQKVAQLLSAYLDGQVDDRERYLVEQHLSTCPVCQRELESLRQVVRLLNRLPPVTPPYPFTLHPEWVAPARPPVWRWLFGVPGLATGLAALMCIIMLAGVLLYNQIVSYRPVMPLARVPVTHSIPGIPTVVSIPGVTSTATPTVSSPAVARDVLSPSAESSLPGSMPASPIPGQPGEPPAPIPTPSPEAREEYGTPSPTPLVVQPERESAAGAQPSPQQAEVPGEATVEEDMRAQRYVGAASPEPSFTIPPTAGAMVVSAATEAPVAQPPTEEVVIPSEPSPAAIGAAVPPTTTIPAAPTPSAEKAAAPSDLPPAVTTPVKPTEMPETAAEPSPVAAAAVIPPETETPAVPVEVPTTPPPVEVPEVSAEPSPTAEAKAVPPETEIPAMPAEVPVTSPPGEVLSAEPSPAAEVEAAPPETETPIVPVEVPTVSPTEGTLTSIAEEGVLITPTSVEPDVAEAPSIGPTEIEPTPTRIPIPVRDLRLTIKPGLIHIEGTLPLPPGQLIQAELWREGQLVEWAIPETQRGEVQEEGRFELALRAQPDHPDFDLLKAPPAHYEVRIVPLKFEAPVEARIPFDTSPPATKQP
ncbi:MAG: hypothetical protein DDG58_03830 [Ardenticatenia bacterium]|nr:MAG: hypothetical protein DDG58_03830 [Ardenticatenia bacterium]